MPELEVEEVLGVVINMALEVTELLADEFSDAEADEVLGAVLDIRSETVYISTVAVFEFEIVDVLDAVLERTFEVLKLFNVEVVMSLSPNNVVNTSLVVGPEV